MENFTPFSAAIGGALIGLSAVILMASLGRISGISGIFSGALFALSGERGWRLAFLLGLVAAPIVLTGLFGYSAEFNMDAEFPMIIVAGLLVGFGTRLGSGCTSGHGVCGLARLSVRSMVSVALFMGTGMVTVGVMRGVLG